MGSSQIMICINVYAENIVIFRFSSPYSTAMKFAKPESRNQKQFLLWITMQSLLKN
jgi:hypothetical protein